MENRYFLYSSNATNNTFNKDESKATKETVPFKFITYSNLPISEIVKDKSAFNECQWLDIYQPTHNDLFTLSSALSIIHPLTIEDIQDSECREKYEEFPGYSFLCIHLMDEDSLEEKVMTLQSQPTSTLTRHHSSNNSDDGKDIDEKINSINHAKFTHVHEPYNNNCLFMIVLIDGSLLITIHYNPIPSYTTIINKRLSTTTVNETAAHTTLTTDYLLYTLLDEQSLSLQQQCQALQAEIDSIEDLSSTLKRFDQLDLLRRIYLMQRRLTFVQRAVEPKLRILKRLCHQQSMCKSKTILDNSSGFADENTTKSSLIYYFRDVRATLKNIKRTLADYNECLDRCHDTFTSQTEVELSTLSHQRDKLLKKMTAFTLIVGGAVMVSGCMGMNMKVPFQGWPDEPAWEGVGFFWGVIGVVSVGMVTVWYYGHSRKEWF